ncbi:MAG: GIY-YIG nuclease family protein [Betaproteobacteria bacterium]|nr:GIY-YIG nuclease family protein [Betaproteobacteria bacterium]MDH5287483.1 GIY-YIG nuclease family protein [Betaproteobacteria bacterium]
MDERSYWVYIMASKRNGTLYVGVTSDLAKRAWEHREDFVKGFTSSYRVHRLVWFEQHATAEAAITREKQIKRWNRAWKVRAIEALNPYWNDLYESLSE